MNKTTLSLAAMAAVSVSVSAQAATPQEIHSQLLTEIGVLIQKISLYGDLYEGSRDNYVLELTTLQTELTADTELAKGEKYYRDKMNDIDARSTKELSYYLTFNDLTNKFDALAEEKKFWKDWLNMSHTPAYLAEFIKYKNGQIDGLKIDAKGKQITDYKDEKGYIEKGDELNEKSESLSKDIENLTKELRNVAAANTGSDGRAVMDAKAATYAANDAAKVELNEKVKDLRTNYDGQLEGLVKNLTPDKNDYLAWYEKAKKELSVAANKIDEAYTLGNVANDDTKKVGYADDAEGGVKATIESLLTDANTLLTTVPTVLEKYTDLKQAYDDAWKGVTDFETSFNKYVEGLTGAGLLDDNKEAVDKIRGEINALKDKLTEGRTSGTEDKTVFDTAAAMESINTQFTALQDKTNTAVAEFNAHFTMTDEVGKVVAYLDETVKEATETLSEDGLYNAGAHFTGVEKTHRDALAAKATEADGYYKDGTAVVNKDAFLKSLTTIKNLIKKEYVGRWKRGLDAYNTARGKIEAIEPSLTDLTDIVGKNTTVPILLEGYEDKSYGNVIDAVKADTTKITDGIAGANKKDGADHILEMERVAKWGIGYTAEQLIALKAAFAADKAHYDKQVTIDAAETMLGTAQRLANGLGNRITDVKNGATATDCGDAQSTAIGTKADALSTTIATAFDELKTKYNAIDEVTGDTEDEIFNKKHAAATAFSKAVTDFIAKANIGTDAEKSYTAQVEELEKALDNAKKSYKEYNARVKQLNDIEAAITKQKNYIDSKRSTYGAAGLNYFYDKVLTEGYEAQYNKAVTDLATDLEKVTCHTENALVKKAALDNLKKEIDKVQGRVDANEKAHNSQVDAFTKLENDVNKLYNKIQTEDKTSEATHRLAEIEEARATTIEQLKKMIADKFAAGLSDTDKKEVADLQKTIQDMVDRLGKEITGDEYKQAMIATNQANHERFVAAYNTANETFSAAVKDLSLFASITDPQLKNVVSGELLKVHTKIYEYVDKLRQLYIDEDAAYSPYKATGDKVTELYEVGVWVNKANEYNDDIDAKMEEYRTTLNTAAKAIYDNLITDADNAIAAANTELVSRGYSEEVRKEAYADITKSVTEAKEMAGLLNANGTIDPLFAYKVQSYLETLNSIADLITAENDVLANKEWNYRKAEAQTKIQWEAEMLAGFEPSAILGPDGQPKVTQERIDAAKKFNEQFAKDIEAAQKAYTEIAGDQRYESLTVALNGLPKFNTTIVYEDKEQMQTKNFALIYNDLFADGLNKKAFDDVFAVVAKAREGLAGTIDFINSFFEAHHDGSASAKDLQNIEAALDKFLSDAEAGYTKGNCADVLTRAKAYCEGSEEIPGTISVLVSELRVKMLTQYEPIALKGQVTVLKGLYNDVVAQDLNKADKEIEAAINAITGKVDDVVITYNTAIAENPNNVAAAETAAQTAYLAIEKEIAGLYKKLIDLNEEKTGAFDEAVEALDGACGGIDATLATIDSWFAEFENIKDIEFGSPKSTYGDAVDDVKEALAELRADIESKKADESLLFHKDNLDNDLDGVKAMLDEILKAGGLETVYQKYRENKDAYTALTAQMGTLTTALDEVYTKVMAYEEEDVQFPGTDVLVDAEKQEYKWVDYRTYWYNGVKDIIAASTEALDKDYADVVLTKDDVDVDNKANIEKGTEYLLAKSTYVFAAVRMSDKFGDLDDVMGKLNANSANPDNGKQSKIKRYLPSVENELRGKYWDILNALSALNDYNGEADNGVLNRDIDGNPYLDKDENPAPVTLEGGYMDVADEIEAKYQTLKTEVEQLVKDAEEKSFYVGDANADGLVNVSDYNTIRAYILDPENSTFDKLSEAKAGGADVNGDREINVSDLTCVSNLMFHNDWAWTDEETDKPAASPAMARAMMAVPVQTADAVTMAVESEETTIFGKKVRLAVNLDNAVEYVGYQLDVKLPEGMTLAGESLTDRANGHELMSADIAGGWHRVLVSMLDNNAFMGNSGAMLYLDVEVSGDYKGGDVELSNVIFSDAKGLVYKLAGAGSNEATGITDITAPTVKERIYSVGGQMMKAVKKGVNIIVGSDGTTKKVFNK